MKQPEKNAETSDLLPSKSEIKREAHKLQELGKNIFALSNKQRAQLPLTTELVNAFEEAKRISSKEALRRHFQYIGKLIRNTDIAALENALDKLGATPKDKSRKILALETLTQRLIEEDIDLSEVFIEQHPGTDRKKLRQLIRNAKKQATPDEKTNLKVHAAHKLFEYLKQQVL